MIDLTEEFGKESSESVELVEGHDGDLGVDMRFPLRTVAEFVRHIIDPYLAVHVFQEVHQDLPAASLVPVPVLDYGGSEHTFPYSEQAAHQILGGLDPVEFEGELAEIVKAGKKVVLLTKGFKLAGAKIYETKPEPGQLRFITDSSYVLTGELTGDEHDTCLYSGQKNLVEVMKEALKDKITLLGGK